MASVITAERVVLERVTLLLARPFSRNCFKLVMSPVCTKCPVTVWQMDVMLGARDESALVFSNLHVLVEVKDIRTRTKNADFLLKAWLSVDRLGSTELTMVQSCLMCPIQAIECVLLRNTPM